MALGKIEFNDGSFRAAPIGNASSPIGVKHIYEPSLTHDSQPDFIMPRTSNTPIIPSVFVTGMSLADGLKEYDITAELYREYDFGGRVYRIDLPSKLYMRKGGTTHRVLDSAGVVHCVPIPGEQGCALRWKNKDGYPPVQF